MSKHIITYNKLVRDNIPQIIKASGKQCIVEVLSDTDYLKMLDTKLDEELLEYHKDQNIEELVKSLLLLIKNQNHRKMEFFTTPLTMLKNFLQPHFIMIENIRAY